MGSLTLLQSLHENLSGRAQVKSVYGEPIVAADKTIVPVARIAYGFGAGAGTGGVGDKNAKGEGGGGGGGVHVRPVGIFVVDSREARFIGVHDKRKTIATLFAGMILGALILRRRRR
jgi:uncharacterized spore protein YtfJ